MNPREFIEAFNHRHDPEETKVICTLTILEDGFVTLDTLQTWPTNCRRQGRATAALRKLTAMADEAGIFLTANLRPFSPPPLGITLDDLRRLFLRFGFEPLSDEPGETSMIRAPR